MHAARVTVVVPCVCNDEREIVTDLSQYGNDLKKEDFCKNVSFKSYYLEQLWCPSTVFSTK